MPDDNTMLKPFEFHGLEFNGSTKTQAKTDCPCCGATNKFYVALKDGRYHCKVCGVKGNKNTFLSVHHDALVKAATDEDAKRIRKLRGNVFSTKLIKEKQLCFNETGEILFPQKNPEGKTLSNLRKWSPETKKLYNTPGCYSLYFAQWSDDPEVPVYMCEGEWDALALIQLMRRARYEKEVVIVSVPGANGFKDSWVKRFAGRNISIVFDNDHNKKRRDRTEFNPAQEGTDALVGKLNGVAKSIRTVRWKLFRDGLSDGFDIRDILIEAVKTKKSKRLLGRFLKSCRTVATKPPEGKQPVVVLKRDNFEAVVDDFKEAYAINQSFIDSLACCIAAIAALKIKGNPLWLFLVAPPSSGKTTIIEAFEAAYKHTVHLSKLTATSLISGGKVTRTNDEGEEEEIDPSIFAKLGNKVLFVKDFTAVLSMGSNDQEALFGLLRDGYDGSFRQTYGNGVERVYEDHYFGIVAGVTHAIHGENQSSLGERFLKINLLDEEFVEVDHIRRALNNIKANKSFKAKLQGSIIGFLNHIDSIEKIPEIPNDSPLFEKLINLSQLVALIRTKVERVHGRDMTYRPEPEIGTRIATQLSKVGAALAMVYGDTVVTDRCYRVMQRMALDSCVGYQLEVLNVLDRSNAGMSATTIATAINLSVNQVRKITDDMMQLNLIESRRVSNNSGRRGNKIKGFFITKSVRALMKAADLSFKGKKRVETPSGRTKRSKKKRNQTQKTNLRKKNR